MTLLPRSRAAIVAALLLAAAPPLWSARSSPASPATARPAAAAPAAKAVRGASAITAAQLRDYLSFIASDDLEGRDTPSRGLDVTARFLATTLARAGAEPAGDAGSYFQRIPLTKTRVDAARSRARVSGAAAGAGSATGAGAAGRTFVFGRDFLAGMPAGYGAPVSGTAAGSLVYVGHGYVIEAKNIDAYEGIDVRGKILVSHGRLPKGATRDDVRGKPGEAWDNTASYAARHGAVGIIYVPDFETLARWERTRVRQVEQGSTTMDRPPSDGDAGDPAKPAVPAITASAAMLQAIFEGEAASARELFRRVEANEPGDAFALSAARQVRFSLETIARPLATQNVVAIVRGSDPVLKQEYVALGAHYDHVGVRSETSDEPADDGDGGGHGAHGGATAGEPADRIFNGADDDGSGTTALLAMAEAFAKMTPRPKRSILFVWHAGEEHGLWGSAYFTDHPTVPLAQIVTQLNIDMIGRSRAPDDKKPANAALTGPHEIYVIGSKMMSQALADTSERVNASFWRLSFNYKYDDLADPSRLFYRSDHYNYARKGIPIIFYFSGLHEDYHQPSDSVDKIDFAKMEKVTQTIYATALDLAQAPTRPKVDKALPKEATDQ